MIYHHVNYVNSQHEPMVQRYVHRSIVQVQHHANQVDYVAAAPNPYIHSANFNQNREKNREKK